MGEQQYAAASFAPLVISQTASPQLKGGISADKGKLDEHGLPPAFPALKGGISADKGKLDEHLAIVLNGTSGTAMASFSYLSDADIAAIITYERNAWGHNTGQLLTPEAVKAAR